MGLGMDIILTDLSSPIASKPLDPIIGSYVADPVGSKLHREMMFYELCVRRKKLLVPTGNCGSHGEFDPGSG